MLVLVEAVAVVVVVDAEHVEQVTADAVGDVVVVVVVELRHDGHGTVTMTVVAPVGAQPVVQTFSVVVKPTGQVVVYAVTVLVVVVALIVAGQTVVV